MINSFEFLKTRRDGPGGTAASLWEFKETTLGFCLGYDHNVFVGGLIAFLTFCIHYVRLTFARVKHFVCHGSLMTTHI